MAVDRQPPKVAVKLHDAVYALLGAQAHMVTCRHLSLAEWSLASAYWLFGWLAVAIPTCSAHAEREPRVSHVAAIWRVFGIRPARFAGALAHAAPPRWQQTDSRLGNSGNSLLRAAAAFDRVG